MPTCQARSAGKGRTHLVICYKSHISTPVQCIVYIHSYVSTIPEHTRSIFKKDIIRAPQAPSFHPIGTNAAATCCNPLSVANKLNCAAAFLVS